MNNNKIKILVVEDNLLNQRLATFMLNDWGYSHDICSNGKLALDNLKHIVYDLILMDIQMPELNGYEATEYIRKHLKLDIPIIAMTAYSKEDEKEKCFSSGMSDYISKPIKEKQLHKMLVKFLETN